MMYPFFDGSMLLLIPALLLTMWAQFRVKSTFERYSQVRARGGITAAEVARRLLDRFGLQSVAINHVGGNLTDHYDPRDRTLSLSDPVYGSSSIAAIGVAAHEVGHAIQHSVGYSPLAIRNSIVPVVNLTSSASIPLFFLGFLFQYPALMNIGIALFLGVIIFHVITLPVELNASRRAIAILSDTGVLASDELSCAGKVLRAAAWTYIAAALMAISQLFRLLMLRNSRNN